MSPDAAAKIWEDTINRKLSDLVHSQANFEKLGGILAIGKYMSIVSIGFLISLRYRPSFGCEG